MTDPHLSPANEDYLETIVELARIDESEGVRSVDIAERHDVSKASVSKAINTLKEAGLVEQSHYGRVTLTPEGKAYGESVLERHMFLKDFLVEQLGVDPEVADEEACMMEHAISEDTAGRWVAYLKRCSGCPQQQE